MAQLAFVTAFDGLRVAIPPGRRKRPKQGTISPLLTRQASTIEGPRFHGGQLFTMPTRTAKQTKAKKWHKGG